MALKKRINRNRRSSSSKSDESQNTSKQQGIQNAKRMRFQEPKKGNYSTTLSGFFFVFIVSGLFTIFSFLKQDASNDISSSADPHVAQLWSTLCSKVTSCSKSVNPIRRTLQASHPVAPGEVIAEIPRQYQIWDLDALRDKFVRTELLSARHSKTLNPLPSGAFLAAFLALKALESQSPGNSTVSNHGVDTIEREYFNSLPSLDDFSHHPISWSFEELWEDVGKHSVVFGLTTAYQKMIGSEYEAFSSISSQFRSKVFPAKYRLARMWVLTRSFSPGPIGPQNEMNAVERSLYKQNVATDFSKGCHVMVPILDALNHHPEPNVLYEYNQAKSAFQIRARQSISSGHEIYDSYGAYSDSHLFAKFGFVNGDGSAHTQASIALFHRMLDSGINDEFSYLSLDGNQSLNMQIVAKQLSGLTRYLRYDDGYRDCIIGPSDGDAYKLKELKLKYLVQIANNSSRWMVTVPPRQRKSQPAFSSNQLITEVIPDIDIRKVRMNVNPLLATCRLLSMIHSDYEGQAISILEQNLDNASTFFPERGSDSLEYRAFMFLGRLAGNSLLSYKAKIEEDTKFLANTTLSKPFTTSWNIAHVRLGEMQVLRVLSGIAFSQAKQWQDRIPVPVPSEFIVRERLCPKEYSELLTNSLSQMDS